MGWRVSSLGSLVFAGVADVWVILRKHNDADFAADTAVRAIYTHCARKRCSSRSVNHSQYESYPATMLKSLILGLFQASATLATWAAYQEYLQSHNSSFSTQGSNRPSLVYSPKRPYKKMHSSPKRHRQCVVKSHNDFKTDDSSYVLQAVEKCNDGGHVLFPEGTNYVIGAALDLTGLKHIDIGESSGLMTWTSRMRIKRTPH